MPEESTTRIAGEEFKVTVPRVFEWPCEKRRAHGPHQSACAIHAPYPALRCRNCITCPGVKAHPSTQIGGSYDEW